MDRDRKAPGLESLQGQIWAGGFREGTLNGEMFPDVPPALGRWHDAGVRVAIYSSGSVLAQRLVFGTTPYGDLTSLMYRFFDTAVGPKTSADSYRRIAEAVEVTPSRVLFISDVSKELDAARESGMQTLLCVRPPAQLPPSSTHRIIEDFGGITR